MNLSIVKKVNLLAICTILVVGSLLGAYFIRHEARALNIELDERANVLLSSLSISCEYPVLINDKESLSKLVEGVLEQKDVVFCSIEDRVGNVLFQEGSLKSEAIRVFTTIIKVIRTTEEMSFQMDFEEVAEEEEEEEIGKISLTVSLSGLNQKIEDVTKAMVVIVVFMIIMASLASSILLKFILSNPINQLVKGTERIAKGDLDYKVPVKSKDEIGRLGNSFNKMTDDLQRVTVSMDYVDNIINSMNDVLIVINPDTTIRTVNKAIVGLLDYTDSELIGKPMEVLLSEDVALFKGKEWEDLLSKGTVRDYDMNYKSKSGESIPVSFSGSVMRGEDGIIVSIVGIARDMREMLRLKKQLFQTEKMAAVGQLAGGVAHEINNPMSVILGFSQTIARGITDEKDRLYMPLKSIEREAIRCKKLVGDLLTFSRVSKSGMEEVDVGVLIDETVSLVESKCRVNGVELKWGVSEKTPKVRANKNQIQQIIVNICNNAIDAMADKGGNLFINSDEFKKGGIQYAEIKITDTGSGIPPDVKDHIFEPFFTTKEVGKGTGLGLSISYEIIQKHGGVIEVESEPNKGTTFIIRLPIG